MRVRTSAVALAWWVAGCHDAAPPAVPPPVSSAVSVAAPPPAPSPDPPAAKTRPTPKRTMAGPLAIDLYQSRTPQLFHIVDHLSRWSPLCHPQYARWAQAELPLDDVDRAMLAKHAELRRVRGWGSGFEAAFYVEDDLDGAAQAAIEGNLLSVDEARAEYVVLSHFAPKLEPLLERERPTLRAFEELIAREAPRIGALADKVARLTDVKGTVVVPVLPIADPSADALATGAGGHDGGRLVLEVPEDADPSATLFHALFHALLMKRRESLAVAAAKCAQPIDEETLQEGIAYAIAPGILHTEEGDPLARMVNDERAARKTLRRSQVRFHRFALALRPTVQSALDSGGAWGKFLPVACTTWKKVARK